MSRIRDEVEAPRRPEDNERHPSVTHPLSLSLCYCLYNICKKSLLCFSFWPSPKNAQLLWGSCTDVTRVHNKYFLFHALAEKCRPTAEKTEGEHHLSPSFLVRVTPPRSASVSFLFFLAQHGHHAKFINTHTRALSSHLMRASVFCDGDIHRKSCESPPAFPGPANF